MAESLRRSLAGLAAVDPELPDRIATLIGTIYQQGWVDGVGRVSELLADDERAGIAPSPQRVLAHLYAAGREPTIPEQLQ